MLFNNTMHVQSEDIAHVAPGNIEDVTFFTATHAKVRMQLCKLANLLNVRDGTVRT